MEKSSIVMGIFSRRSSSNTDRLYTKVTSMRHNTHTTKMCRTSGQCCSLAPLTVLIHIKVQTTTLET